MRITAHDEEVVRAGMNFLSALSRVDASAAAIMALVNNTGMSDISALTTAMHHFFCLSEDRKKQILDHAMVCVLPIPVTKELQI